MSVPEITSELSRCKLACFADGPLEGCNIERPEFHDRYCFTDLRGSEIVVHTYRLTGMDDKGHLLYSYVGERPAEVWSK